jgi:hypothetical protein
MGMLIIKDTAAAAAAALITILLLAMVVMEVHPAAAAAVVGHLDPVLALNREGLEVSALVVKFVSGAGDG